MSKSNTFENDLLKLIFNGTPIAGLADNAASSPLATFYVALHTADPGEAGDQTTNEVSYTGYARVAVSRTAGGWTVTGSSVSPVANVDFGSPSGVSGTPVATHVTFGTALSGAGKVLYFGALSPTITIANGVPPRVTTVTAVTED